MKLEYTHTSTVAHGDGSGTANAAARKKAKAKRAHAKTSTGKMAKAIRLVRSTEGSKSQAGKGMVKSIRRKQAKRANWQHEG